MLDDRDALTVTDLKQYAYCPRVVYYEHCLPHVRPRTYKMDAGKARHEDEAERSSRRVITRYSATGGERQFNLRLFSDELALWGLLDEVIFAQGDEAIPVDYKVATTVSLNHRIQLAAYAILLETCLPCTVRRGFIYLTPKRKALEVSITAELRSRVYAILHEIQVLIAEERIPSPVKRKGQCVSCEFRRFCNDV